MATWNVEQVEQIDAVRNMIGAALDIEAGIITPAGAMAVHADDAAVLDPLLTATNQGTCMAALEAGDPGQIVAAAGRALAQSVQIDFGGVRP